MLALALLAQTAVALPADLASIRSSLERGDTVSAVVELRTLTQGDVLTSQGLTALFLLDWISRGSDYEDLGGYVAAEHRRHVALWQDQLARGVMLPDRYAEARGRFLRALQGYASEAFRWVTPATPGSVGWVYGWQTDSTARPSLGDSPSATDLGRGMEAAAREVTGDPWFGGAVQWVLLQVVLARLDDTVRWVPEVQRVLCPVQGSTRYATARGGCMRPERPPSEYRLANRIFSDTTTARLLTTIEGRFLNLSAAPWPFNALAARAHAAVCALLLAGPSFVGCWPETAHLDGRDEAEVRALTYAFTSRHALAGKVMEAHPEWFAHLDAERDVVDPPDSVELVSRIDGAAVSGYKRRRIASDAPDTRLPPEQFWRAAWPLYLQPYNERLVVHRARLLLADVLTHLAPPGRLALFAPYGDPEVIVQAGVPLAILVGPGSTEMQSFHGRELAPGRRRPAIAFVPPETHETAVYRGTLGALVSLDLALVARGSSDLRVGTGFASEDYDTFEPLDHQVVHYLRDGRRRVDIYTRWSAPPRCRDPRPLLGFFLLDEQFRELSRAVEVDLETRPRKVFRFSSRPGPYVYSLEMLDRGCRRAERARYVIVVPPVADAFLSDLMLADELYYGDQHRAADRLRDRVPATISPSLRVFAGETARFYWEIYAMDATETAAGRLAIHFEVVNVRQERVSVRELGAVARQAERAHGTLDIDYRVSVPPGTAPLTVGLAVGIPAGTRGVHIARVTVTDTATGRTAVVERAFYVAG